MILLALLPIYCTSYLPLLDAPSHESRLVVLHNLLVSHAGSPFYGLDTLLLPNMSFDAVGLVLTGVVSPEAAGRIFFAATIVLTFTGVLAIGRVAHGHVGPLQAASGLLLYNLFTVLGFLSYGFGIGLTLWAIALRLRLERSLPAFRWTLGAAFPIVLLLCHVSAFAVYATMLAGFGVERLLSRRSSLLQIAVMGLETLPAVGLFARMSTGGEGRMHYDLPYLSNKLFGAVKTVSAGSMTADAAFLVGVAAIGGMVLLCGRVRLDRRFVPGLLGLALLFFVVPAHISGGSYVDSRIPAVLALLALAAARFELRTTAAASRLRVALLSAAALAFVVKQAALAALWSEEGGRLDRIAAILDTLPDGAVLMQTECQPAPGDVAAVYASRQPPLSHVAAMAAFSGRRFAAVSWTIKGQQPVFTLPAYAPFRALQDRLGVEVCTREANLSAFAAVRAAALQASLPNPVYLVLLRPRAPGQLQSVASLVARAPELEIYEVTPPGTQ